MSEQSRRDANDFILNETQFHLGFLPTEQSNALTRDLDRRFAVSVESGVRCLQRVDRDVAAMAVKIFESAEFSALEHAIFATVSAGGRVVFSGCGATGRLAILLESMWRDGAARGTIPPDYADGAASIMTGGDFALIRSVEFFEDYPGFGAQQVAELGMTSHDLLVAITEGGETSSVLGSVYAAADLGCRVFLLFNNPAALLAEHIERSRRAINDPRVTVIDLSCGPMALAGSTRMQATTSEQLVAGAALENAALRLAGKPVPDRARDFAALLDALETSEAVTAIADCTSFEAATYADNGLITYFADRFLLDIFTDTTERSPTFMLPPFRRNDDRDSPPPWAFVKNPLAATADTWAREFLRPLRCLDWGRDKLLSLGAPVSLAARPPAISAADMLKIEVGNENISERRTAPHDAAVAVTLDGGAPEFRNAFAAAAEGFGVRRELRLDRFMKIPGSGAPLELMEHLALKLVLNTISTGTMVLLGRVTGNWMSWVDCSNKKLIDRATRLVCEIGGLEYRDSCERIFAAREELAKRPAGAERVSPVQQVLKSLPPR